MFTEKSRMGTILRLKLELRKGDDRARNRDDRSDFSVLQTAFDLYPHQSAHAHRNEDSERRSSAVGWLAIEVRLGRVSKVKGV